ncbi:hypothetical protein HC028_13065 [Planosporangium flavigriseum]|uniref:Uncharacterized protein n=1 Tax=Planosporangium flavigriseum TaxID=373681 RepID=A0A8J3LSL3_9ACTN|nr:hypothetical protein [Planosporangium flavigriseum]NJC65429.1 hypothetical protein [Planosporangium flavigriseum]GIG75883.1 hypothetical protein Pfl04_42870 [Planosporangium flavigriseum]
MADEIEALRRARAAARAYAAASQDMVDFLDRTSAVPDPQQEAEYAALLGIEELQRKQREDALREIGLVVRSVGEA